MKKYLLTQWVGLSFAHWLLVVPMGIHLATYPLARWSFQQVAIALWVFLFSLILSFWTIYLLGWSVPSMARRLMPWRVPLLTALHRSGQVTTLLILLMGVARLLPGVWPDGEFFNLTDRSLFWIMQAIAFTQGLHHFFYKFTSGSQSRLDGLLDQIGQGRGVDWRYPLGGSIGVELRRLRRVKSMPVRYLIHKS